MAALAPNAAYQALTNLVRDCSVSGVPRRALLLRTDLLPPPLSRPHHLRLAAEALEPLIGADRAQRYDIPDGRVAVSWRGDASDRLRQVLESLAHLLLDAPLDAPSMPELARLFDLPRDGAALLALASGSAGAMPPQPEPRAGPKPPAPLPPLDLARLDAIEERLSNANVARFARRRPVCCLEPSGFAIAWETRFLNIGELMAELAPGCNAFADPWLFRRLTRILDRRTLALLSANGELRGAGPFSLNLNVSGVLAPEFLRFDAALPAALRGKAILDLHPADIMADVPAYRFARAFVQARGYQVLLRGLTPTALAALDIPALDVDYAELHWSPTLAGLDPARLRAGGARWVLARADEPAAVRWGVAAGIGLFCGDAAKQGAPAGRTPGSASGARLLLSRSAA